MNSTHWPSRRSIRLATYDYSATGVYFLTFLTQDRMPLFGGIEEGGMVLNELGRQIESVWLDLPSHYPELSLDAFVIMPDHIHGVLVIDDNLVCPFPGPRAIRESPIHPGGDQREAPPSREARRRMLVSRVIGRFKMVTAKWINDQRQTPGSKVWHRNYHDRVIRDNQELSRIRQYIQDNPARWLENHPVEPA